ncbi:MAG: isoprenylcysteine carboxylmethyltransferase family protein, partial [Nitrospirae bacterium]|nr:isoprenylcysteine carboxylmethyltransferase family protein [Nitrospirota bacterium]
IIMARVRIRRSWPDINWLLKAEGNRFMGYPAGIERMDEKKDKPGVIAPPPLIYLTALIAALPLYLVFSVHLLPGRLGPVLGIFLMSIGVFLAIWAFRVMRAAKTNVNPYQPATALVTDGPFRYSRNPLYMALTLLYCGITFLVNTPWPLLILPAVLFILRRGVIDREERYLEKKFGEAYLQYRASVRRWI